MKYCTYCACERPHYKQQANSEDLLISFCAYCKRAMADTAPELESKPFEEIQKINPPSDRLKEGNVV